LQLCAEVERALGLTLAGECEDPLLDQLVVFDVSPAPDAGRLLVRLVVTARPPPDLAAVYEALRRAQGLLRTAVGAELHRKRVPELAFVVLPAEVAR
jgi:ribosome-binding factor A